VPVQIGKDTDWAYVSAGKGHVLALKAHGTLYAWGRNERARWATAR
jgi:alpha-tubulin suppressor-like RCC1 family protein